MPARFADRHDYPVIWSCRYTIVYDFVIWSDRENLFMSFSSCKADILLFINRTSGRRLLFRFPVLHGNDTDRR